MNEIVLTGDRPTGKLHIGHYVGSLVTRLKMQEEYSNNLIFIADLQALTDNFDNPQKVRASTMEVALDWLAVGLTPERNIFFIQSLIPELAELTVFYMNLVSLARLQRNPTVKTEMNQKGFGAKVPIGFLAYPISQAADITAFKSTIVPVGEDQLPMIEQTNEIVRRFNNIYDCDVLVECKGLLSQTVRLPGTDGNEKMGKSLNNAIYLSDDEQTIKEKIKKMYTDPNHLRVSDPGKVEGNPVFTYLDAFDSDKETLEELKAHYRQGGLGDVMLKNRLNDIMQETLKPIRERRTEYEKDKGEVLNLLLSGSKKAREIAAKTLDEVKTAMMLKY
jgi:tryptophanyl-tRNA synthetase